ncbi:MAG: ATP-binding protein [Candidatus Symbiothrix sp.]|jgi:hypothetical protein|nr:ATP-binding protein [Candidatus Symbiothrix sp.]
MITLTNEFREKVAQALLAQRDNYDGSDAMFARRYGIGGAIYSRLKSGEREGLLQPAKWMSLGRELNVSKNDRKWKAVETEVFRRIREEILFCKTYSKSRIFVDNCGIGKTFTAKYLANTEKNVFYLDCTQCHEWNSFIKAMAKAIGVDVRGTLDELKAETKYYLNVLPAPVVIIDEAGALSKKALGLLQEYWNGTEGCCGWYIMGANALRNKIAEGVMRDRDYFAELFSRFSDKFSSIVPREQNERMEFYKRLITDVISANMEDKSKLKELVRRCLVADDGNISGLRRAESLLILYNNQANEA